MSTPSDYTYFRVEVEQRMHSIIGPQPLQGYLELQAYGSKGHGCSSQKQGAYAQQVQYLIVDINPLNLEPMKQRIASSIQLLLARPISIYYDQRTFHGQISKRNIFIWLNLIQSQAIIELFSFSGDEESFAYEKEWGKKMPLLQKILIENLLREAALYEFTGIKIQSILIANAELRLQVQVQLLIFSIYFQLPLQSMEVQSINATINQTILEILQQSETFLQKKQPITVKISKLFSWKDVETNYLHLSWKKKVELTYRTYCECGLSLPKGRLAKFKSSIYLADVCFLIQEIIAKEGQKLSIEIRRLIQEIVEEDDEPRVYKLFQQLFRSVVQRNGKICS